jgi:hypothetical protein
MLQKGLQDTAGDLAFGMLGAVAILKVGRPAVRRVRSLYRRR